MYSFVRVFGMSVSLCSLKFVFKANALSGPSQGCHQYLRSTVCVGWTSPGPFCIHVSSPNKFMLEIPSSRTSYLMTLSELMSRSRNQLAILGTSSSLLWHRWRANANFLTQRLLGEFAHQLNIPNHDYRFADRLGWERWRARLSICHL